MPALKPGLGPRPCGPPKGRPVARPGEPSHRSPADHFLERICKQSGRASLRLAPAVYYIIQALDWPGNVRELLSCCRYVTAFSEGPIVQADDLPPTLRKELLALRAPPHPRIPPPWERRAAPGFVIQG